MKIATWNVNSIRARLNHVTDWLKAQSPDVVCLQETKVCDDAFPKDALAALGYHSAISGQRAYNGVAILAKSALSDVQAGFDDGVADPQCRLISARLAGLRIISVYVPNGDVIKSEKYTYKLAWLDRLRHYLDKTATREELLMVAGDFNIAPFDHDAARPEAWTNSVICHPQVRQALAEVMAFGLIDLQQAANPSGGIFTWWDYRHLGFIRNDGLRLDLLLSNPILASRCQKVWVDTTPRAWKKPSDHAPVMAEFSL